MSDDTPAPDAPGEREGQWLIGLVVGVLTAVGLFFFLLAGSSVDSARVLDRGAAERVSGVLDSCNGRGALVTGSRWCLERPHKRLEESAIDVAWPEFKELQRFEGEEVVGLVDDGWLLAFELPDGSVVRGTDVGWRGVLNWGGPGWASSERRSGSCTRFGSEIIGGTLWSCGFAGSGAP